MKFASVSYIHMRRSYTLDSCVNLGLNKLITIDIDFERLTKHFLRD